jgi:hypothetical protein
VNAGAGGWAGAQVVALGSPRAAFISDIVAVGGGATLWASCSTVHAGHVFRSTNAGQTWSDCSGNLPDIPINALVVDPANVNIVYAASDNGVYKTSDAASIERFQQWTAQRDIGDLVLHEARRPLRAGTRNRGAWEVGIDALGISSSPGPPVTTGGCVPKRCRLSDR